MVSFSTATFSGGDVDFTASLALGRAADEEVKSGRMTIEEATHTMHHSFLRLLGVADRPQS